MGNDSVGEGDCREERELRRDKVGSGVGLKLRFRVLVREPEDRLVGHRQTVTAGHVVVEV